MLSMFDTVIFDWDGTLADTRAAILHAFHEALAEVKADVPDEKITRLIGIGSAETFRLILNSQDKEFDDPLIRALVATKIRIEIEVDDQVKLFPGVTELLLSLRGKVKLGLASMNNRAVINDLLEITRTKDFFAVTVTADEISRPKPDPEIFLKVAHAFASTPDKCVVVEDSVFGVKAAKAARMTCIAAAQGSYSRKELKEAGADLVVDSLREHAKILDFIIK